MALRKINGKKFRWNVYSTDEEWNKVVALQEHLRLRSRQDVLDIAVEKMYNEVFKNENKKEE